MKNSPLVNTFIAGCPKTGSTWLYNCFKEHPEIYVPTKDAIHYFTINHFRGESWYHRWYKAFGDEKRICDPTPSYIRDSKSAERIYRYNPNSKLIFTLRNPIDRSFSHYWHQKRKKKILFSFQDTLFYSEVGNYDIYDIWIKSSLYYEQLKTFFDVFPRENIKVNLFEDLKKNPNKFIKDNFDFLQVDSSFQPIILNKKVNSAPKISLLSNPDRSLKGKLKSVIKRSTKGINLIAEIDNNTNQDEYSQGVPHEFKKDLWEIFHEDVINLSELIDRDLSYWNPSNL